MTATIFDGFMPLPAVKCTCRGSFETDFEKYGETAYVYQWLYTETHIFRIDFKSYADLDYVIKLANLTAGKAVFFYNTVPYTLPGYDAIEKRPLMVDIPQWYTRGDVLLESKDTEIEGLSIINRSSYWYDYPESKMPDVIITAGQETHDRAAFFQSASYSFDALAYHAFIAQPASYFGQPVVNYV
ncbi:MAG: hypothetical protein HQM04_06535 [Magnetococcales bacterium]|nr:hypothetical protein [Magnetococcales bacterium]MBF0114684.1 hypothetical protein [Magnetococcales bacterium]